MRTSPPCPILSRAPGARCSAGSAHRHGELKLARASLHPSPALLLMLLLLRRTPSRGPLPGSAHVALKAQPTPGLVAQDSHLPTPSSASRSVLRVMPQPFWDDCSRCAFLRPGPDRLGQNIWTAEPGHLHFEEGCQVALLPTQFKNSSREHSLFPCLCLPLISKAFETGPLTCPRRTWSEILKETQNSRGGGRGGGGGRAQAGAVGRGCRCARGRQDSLPRREEGVGGQACWGGFWPGPRLRRRKHGAVVSGGAPGRPGLTIG